MHSRSDMFEEFCQFLGDRIELDGWEGFRGGLDVRTGSTGKYALHTGTWPSPPHHCVALSWPVRRSVQPGRVPHHLSRQHASSI